MFEELSRQLDRVLGRLSHRGLLTEAKIRESMREMKRVFLAADVHFRVTKDFLKRVEARAVGQKTLRSIAPGQQIVKIVHDELADVFGKEGESDLTWSPAPPTVILMVGLQGSGKTTTAAKLARQLKQKGRRPMLAACDLRRPAAVEQLAILSERIGVPMHQGEGKANALDVAKEARRRASREKRDVLIVDSAGRLQIDEPMMRELASIKSALKPKEILLVADAMIGQEAVNVARGFNKRLDVTGFVLTKMDGDARGGAALSIRGVTGKPLKFVGTGEALDQLESVDPRRMAGRILGKGDVVGLVERAQSRIDQEEAKKLEKRVKSGRGFSLADFLVAMRQIQKMGPLKEIMRMVPGLGARVKVPEMGERKLKHVEAIILSMTPDERERPHILNGSRRKRIAKGSGRPVHEVNQLLKRFKEMKKMMAGMKGIMPGFPR